MSEEEEDHQPTYEHLGIESFEQGDAPGLVAAMVKSQVEGLSRHWSARDYALAHAFHHLMNNVIQQCIDCLQATGVLTPENMAERVPIVISLAMAYFSEEMCAQAGNAPGEISEHEEIIMPVLDMQFMGTEEDGTFTWATPAPFVEGPVPDLPKE